MSENDVFEAFRHVNDVDTGIREAAERQLQSLETKPGFFSVLLRIAADPRVAADGVTRLHAAVYLKNRLVPLVAPISHLNITPSSPSRRAVGDPPSPPTLQLHPRANSRPSSVDERELTYLKSALLDTVLVQSPTPVAPVLSCLLIAVSKLARAQWPHRWPTLFPTLLSLVATLPTTPPLDPAVHLRLLCLLHHLLKHLQTLRVPSDITALRTVAFELLVPLFDRVAACTSVLARGCGEVLANLSHLGSQGPVCRMLRLCIRF